MVSPVLRENWYTGGFLVSEANNTLSRDVAVIANATTVDVLLNAGLVLSPVAPTATITAAGTNHATGTAGSVVLNGAYVTGNYTLTATSATNFTVTAPDGRSLPPATVGTAYADAELNFTISAGTGTYLAGDAFTIAAPKPTGTLTPTGTATLPASAVLFNRQIIPASGSSRIAIIARSAEVNSAELQWDATILNSGSVATYQANALTALAAQGIIAR